MRRDFAGLMAGLLLFSLMGCTLFTFAPSQTNMRRMKILGSAMEPNFHDGQIVDVEEVPINQLQRGDVILFTVDEERQYLKRLIGLPGETVEIRAGKVYINDKLLDEPYNPSLAGQDYPSRLLKQDEYFVLGDNRNNSRDSRGFGPISSTTIYGRVKQ